MEEAWSKVIGNGKATRGTCWSERDITSKEDDPTENNISSLIISMSISDTVPTFIKVTKATASYQTSSMKSPVKIKDSNKN